MLSALMSLMTLCRKDKAKMLYENNLTKGLVEDTGRFKILWALKLTFLPDLNSEKIKNHPVILPRTPVAIVVVVVVGIV